MTNMKDTLGNSKEEGMKTIIFWSDNTWCFADDSELEAYPHYGILHVPEELSDDNIQSIVDDTIRRHTEKL